MKYYDLVFKADMEKSYFLLVLHTVGPLRVLMKAPCCLFVFQHWEIILPIYHHIVTVGVQLPTVTNIDTNPDFCYFMCVYVIVEKHKFSLAPKKNYFKKCETKIWNLNCTHLSNDQSCDLFHHLFFLPPSQFHPPTRKQEGWIRTKTRSCFCFTVMDFANYSTESVFIYLSGPVSFCCCISN